MKKKSLATILATITLLVFALAAFTACSKNKHEFSSAWKADETSHWHECTTKNHTDVSEKIAHDFNAGEITTAPTETTDGVKTFTCDTCGYQKTETVAKLTHTHTYATEYSKDETNHWFAATCEHTDLKGGVAAHTFGEWNVTTNPTATEKGEKERVCTVCGYAEREDVDALGAQENSLSVKEGVNLSKSYDRQAVVMTENSFAYNGEGEVTFEYKASDAATFTADAPAAVGDYVVRVSVAGTSEWKGISKEFNFSITKAEIRIGRSEFTSKYKSGNWQKTFELGAGEGVIAIGDGRLEDVRLRVTSDTTGWKNGDSFDLYIDKEDQESGKVYVELIGSDANNYEFGDDMDGWLEATLYCKVDSTEIIGSDDSAYYITVNAITFMDKTLTVEGNQGELTDAIVSSANQIFLKRIEFRFYAVADGVKTQISKVAYREGVREGEFDYKFVNATCETGVGGPDSITFDLMPNVAGFTDANGYWIYDGAASLTVSLEVTTDEVETIEEDVTLHGGELVKGAYYVMKFETGEASYDFELTGTAKAQVGVFKLGANGYFDGNEYNEDEFYLNGTYFVVVYITEGGTGGFKLNNLGL